MTMPLVESREKRTEQRIALPCGRTITVGGRTLIMGIVNVTPDSFSDGGRFLRKDDAVDHALRLLAEGADILDVGGESSRPGSEPVSEEEERARVIPVVAEIRRRSEAPLSIDTTKSTIAREALAAGADMVNDISALRYDPEMASVVAAAGAPVILMHMQGMPKTMQISPTYGDVVAEIQSFLCERITEARMNGISDVLIDPGIGFGKTLAHNLDILRNLSVLASLDCPIVVGLSRKSFIGSLGGNEVADRLGGSIAGAVYAMLAGAAILRVHDVRETREAARVIDSLTQRTDGPES